MAADCTHQVQSLSHGMIAGLVGYVSATQERILFWLFVIFGASCNERHSRTVSTRTRMLMHSVLMYSRRNSRRISEFVGRLRRRRKVVPRQGLFPGLHLYYWNRLYSRTTTAVSIHSFAETSHKKSKYIRKYIISWINYN